MTQRIVPMRQNSVVRLFEGLGQAFQLNSKSFLDQIRELRKFGFKVSSDYRMVTSIFVTGIAKVPQVIDCTCIKRDNELKLLAFVDTPDFEAEEKVYDLYAQLLELYPDTNIDVRVVELCGRKKEEIDTREV